MSTKTKLICCLVGAKQTLQISLSYHSFNMTSYIAIKKESQHKRLIIKRERERRKGERERDGKNSQNFTTH